MINEFVVPALRGTARPIVGRPDLLPPLWLDGREITAQGNDYRGEMSNRGLLDTRGSAKKLAACLRVRRRPRCFQRISSAGTRVVKQPCGHREARSVNQIHIRIVM